MSEETKIIESLVGEIFNWVRANGSYIPRNYKTMGGAWTVDTWALGDVKVQLMDEGATQVVLTDTMAVSMTYGQRPIWNTGTIEELRGLHIALTQG